jgi:hypothetical protein
MQNAYLSQDAPEDSESEAATEPAPAPVEPPAPAQTPAAEEALTKKSGIMSAAAKLAAHLNKQQGIDTEPAPAPAPTEEAPAPAEDPKKEVIIIQR